MLLYQFNSTTVWDSHHPVSTSIMMLYCFTLYPGYCCLSSHRKGPYFKLFSSSLVDRFSSQGAAHFKCCARSCFVIDYPRAYSLCPHFRVLSKYCHVPERFNTSILIERLGLNWQVPGCTGALSLACFRLNW